VSNASSNEEGWQMRRKNETWEAWAARNGTNRAALEARRKAFTEAGDDEETLEALRGTDP
jgi:hypothetical protein